MRKVNLPHRKRPFCFLTSGDFLKIFSEYYYGFKGGETAPQFGTLVQASLKTAKTD